MKKTKFMLLALIGLFLAGGLYLAIEGQEVLEVRTEVFIAGPVAEVWQKLVKVEQWQEWSPIIKRSSGKAEIDSKIKITMSGMDGKSGKDGQSYEPIITDLSENKFFRFQAEMLAGFIFTNAKTFELEETPDGTRLFHTEHFSGMMAPLMWGQVQDHVPQMLNSMNTALKELVERPKP